MGQPGGDGEVDEAFDRWMWAIGAAPPCAALYSRSTLSNKTKPYDACSGLSAASRGLVHFE
jgi:hypothetical protein